MKKFLTLCIALCCTLGMYAQFPDASKWTEGQDISQDLADLNLWGDYSGVWSAGSTLKDGAVTRTPNQSPWWQGTQPNEMALDSADTKYPALGFYVDGAVVDQLIDMYQVIPLPAGYYTVTVNAVYREGTPADTWTSYKAGNPKQNAHLYVTTLNSSDPEDAAVAYDTPIKTLPFSIIEECQFTGADSGTSWKTDGSYTVTDENGDPKVIYYPNCDEGAALHFLAGNYLHELKFILLEDGYIRLGLKKTANIAQDWFPWSNFHIYYEGVADEDAQLDLAYELFYQALDDLNSLQSRMEKQGYEALVGMLGDEILEYDSPDEDLASVQAATQSLLDLRQKYEQALVYAQSLGDLLSMSQDMAVATDFPNKSTFEAAVSAAETVAFAKSPDDINYDANSYVEAFNNLSKARADYLNGQEYDENGAKDFTMLIKQPWFVNAEYTPTLKDNGTWTLDEATWTDINDLAGPGNYTDKLKGTDASGPRTDICSDVVLSADLEATNQWYKYVNYSGWSPGLNLFYQSGLVGVSSGWNSISGGSEEICQQLVGLPNGFYSLKALMRGSGGAGWTDGGAHNIYAKNSNGDEVKSAADATEAEANNNFSEWNWNEYQPGAWKEHKTGIIEVSDGQLLIAAQSCQVMNATGFRLYFHGENPDFDAMITEELNAINADVENLLTFAGDKKYVKDLLANVVLPIQSAPQYEEALGYTKTAKDYIKTASNYMKGYTTPEDYTELFGQYADGSNQANMLQQPLNYVLDLGNSEEDTYEDAQEAAKVYDAYVSYLKVYDQAMQNGNDEINGLIASQTAYLTANYPTAAKLGEYESALRKPLINEILAKLQAEQGEASETNPVEITSLLVNPSFDTDVQGWEGNAPSQNEYARGNAEFWNTTFDMYQVLKDMPSGIYQIKAQALYRDGAGSEKLADCYANWQAAAGDKTAWSGHNAVIYAKGGKREGTDYITSVCDTKETAISFDKYYANEGSYSIGGGGKFLFYDELTEEDIPYADDYCTPYVYTNEDGTPGAAFQYPFDGRVDLEDGTSLFFPESMAGAALRFAKGEYPCGTQVVLGAGEDLRVGIRKSASVSGDWVIFDNFQLFFLGAADESTPEPNPAANLIADDASYNFNDGTVGQWHYLGWNNSGTATNVAPGYNASAGAMALTSTNPNGDPWGAQLLCPLKDGAKLERGNTYIVSFWAKGTVEGDYLAPGAGAYPDPEWNNAEPAVLTTEWKQYTYTLECTEANTAENGNTQVYFNQGKLTGTAYIDRFMVYDSRAEINPENNLISDDESFAFNGGTTGGWKMQGWNNKGSVAAVEPGWNNSAFCLELTPDGSASQNYEAQLPYNLPEAMEVGKTYTLSFYAKAENEGAEIEFGAQLSPWAAGNKEWNGNMFTLTTDWAAYSIEVTVTEDFPADGLNCLYINYGKTNGKAYVDHIVLVESIPAEVNPEGNMIADDASFGFEDGTTGQWNFLGWNNSGTRENAAPGYGSEGCMVLTSTNSAGDPWGAQLLCPLKTPVMIGGEYEITFYAKADNEGDYINPGIAKAYPEPEWNTAANAVLTTEWQKFTYTLVADENNTAADGNSNFYFNHGKLTGNAYVDRVTVICTKDPISDAINGISINNAPATRVNLAGQAVGADFKGVVIENGKKLLVK